MTYFDPIRGYVTSSDDYESDTTANLKSIMAALKAQELSDDICDAVERMLYKYQDFICQGIRQDIAEHKDVSWYLVEKCGVGDRRALISYQDGPSGEWFNECFADEVPLWLLISLFRRIARCKPLGDQDADDTIDKVEELDAVYVSDQDERDIKENRARRLNVRRRSGFIGDGDL